MNHVGRIFFDTESRDGFAIPVRLKIITLDSHVGNVHRLATHWQTSAEPNTPASHTAEGTQEITLWEATRERVLFACQRHDQAKPISFKITYNAKAREFGYSFAGHRFKVSPKEPYEDALIRGHHDFSVGDVIAAAYQLRDTLGAYLKERDPDNRALSDLLAKPESWVKRYRDDLYILEMCDQIEASLETFVLSPDTAEPRNFMDYNIFTPAMLDITEIDKASEVSKAAPNPGNDQLDLFAARSNNPVLTGSQPTFFLEPYPLDREKHGDSLEMSFETITLEVPESLQVELIGHLSKDAHPKAAKALQHWIVEELERDGLDSESPRRLARQTLKATILPLPPQREKPTLAQIHEILGFPALNPMQQEVRSAIVDVDHDDLDGTGILLRSPTGSGKMEAVVWPCLEAGRRLLMALPTRSLLDDHAQRIEMILCRAARATGRTYTMIIDTGAQTQQILWTPKGRKIGNARHLYQADIILTTLDKLVYRYFGYTDKTKSMVFPLRIAQSKTLLCFDEAHSYEGMAWSNFRMLVQALYQAGQDLVLMTATMPAHLIRTFEGLEVIDYNEGKRNQELIARMRSFREQNAVWRPEKRLRWKPVAFACDENTDPFAADKAYEEAMVEALVSEIVEAIAAGKKRIIAMANTVDTAIAVYQRLAEHPQQQACPQELLLYHGRLAGKRWLAEATADRRRWRPQPSPRQVLYRKLKALDEARDSHGYLLICTHAIEVGCDLDAALLITPCCGPDSLIQRAGRCNRRCITPEAEVLILGDRIPSYLASQPKEVEANYINYLREQTAQPMDANALAAFLVQEEKPEDPRQIELFQMLYEYVYQGELLHEQIHKKGMLATRSWEPSVVVRARFPSKEGEFIDEVSVPLTRLGFRKDEEIEVPPHLQVFEQRYNPDAGQYQQAPLTSGNAYAKREISVEIGPEDMIAGAPQAANEYYDETLGLARYPRVFKVIRLREQLKVLATDMSQQPDGKAKGSTIHFLAAYDVEI